MPGGSNGRREICVQVHSRYVDTLSVNRNVEFVTGKFCSSIIAPLFVCMICRLVINLMVLFTSMIVYGTVAIYKFRMRVSHITIGLYESFLFYGYANSQ